MSKFIEVSFFRSTSFSPDYIFINVDKIIHVRSEDGYAVITLSMDCEQTHDFKTDMDYDTVIEEIAKVCGQQSNFSEFTGRCCDIRAERELPF